MRTQAFHATSRPGRLLSIIVLVLSVALLATVAIRLGSDRTGDLRNYHYYGGWALLNKRVGFDLAPGQLQTYHHPLLDAFLYRLLRWLNAYPRLFTAAWSVPQGIAVWMMYRVASTAFSFVPRARSSLAVVATVIGGSSAAALGVVGTSMSEAIPNLLVYSAIWLVLRADRAGRGSEPMTGRYAMAGLLAGTAAVLKLTTSAYLIGFGSAIVAMKLLEPALPRWRALAAFVAGAVLALLALGGPWWLAVYRAFGNPLFPYYNTIFHSPYYADANLFDLRFQPRTTSEWLTYPLEWAFQTSNRTSEDPVRDPRMLFELLAGLLLVGGAIVARLSGRARPFEQTGALVWCTIFALVSYVCWLRMFSILRYASALEMLSGILIIGAAAVAVPRLTSSRPWSLVGLSGGLAITLLAYSVTPVWFWERNRTPGSRLIDVQIPKLAPDSTVFLLGPTEMAFLAPFEPASVRFIGLNNNFVQFWQSNGFDGLIAQAVASATGPLWSVSGPGPLPVPAVKSLEKFGLRRTEACEPVTASIASAMSLCRVERIPQS